LSHRSIIVTRGIAAVTFAVGGVGRFELRRTRHVAVLGLRALPIALGLAQHFGGLHGGNN
jgi:hypothetical protein